MSIHSKNIILFVKDHEVTIDSPCVRMMPDPTLSDLWREVNTFLGRGYCGHTQLSSSNLERVLNQRQVPGFSRTCLQFTNVTAGRSRLLQAYIPGLSLSILTSTK